MYKSPFSKKDHDNMMKIHFGNSSLRAFNEYSEILQKLLSKKFSNYIYFELIEHEMVCHKEFRFHAEKISFVEISSILYKNLIKVNIITKEGIRVVDFHINKHRFPKLKYLAKKILNTFSQEITSEIANDFAKEQTEIQPNSM